MIRRVLLIVAITAAGLHAASCDRACLRGLVDNYLDALAKHDPSKLPAAAAVKFMSGVEQLDKGLFKDLTIDHRRSPVADRENGVVLGMVQMHATIGWQ